MVLLSARPTKPPILELLSLDTATGPLTLTRLRESSTVEQSLDGSPGSIEPAHERARNGASPRSPLPMGRKPLPQFQVRVMLASMSAPSLY